ncbi:MAG TPA: 3-oxoacid CoA-transferase subunit B [Candidatus Acidoferrum sp.]|nr:3-oxoacid CoA-transferase subunit B [Candidatus Acidoferrum sp.]
MNLDRQQIAWRVAQDIADGSYVNLGSGMPLAVADHIPDDREVIIHSENGLLGVGPRQTAEPYDRNLINAGNIPVTLRAGGAYFHHADSFMMVRGGHLDVTVLGAYQVAENGDLANWDLPAGRKAPAVGGAMDLAVGAKKVFVMMEYFARDGSCKIVPQCTLPLTGRRCVTSIYTDLAVLDIVNGRVVVRELIEGITLHTLQAETPVMLHVSPRLRLLQPPSK